MASVTVDLVDVPPLLAIRFGYIKHTQLRYFALDTGFRLTQGYQYLRSLVSTISGAIAEVDRDPDFQAIGTWLD